MIYIQGFVAAVPTKNKAAYTKHAEEATPLFHEFGASRVVEAWGDDVPTGKNTDFNMSVQAKADESIVYSWHEYASAEVAAAAYEKMMKDPRMEKMGSEMPFDGSRMIFGGFDAFVYEKPTGKMGYVDGSLIPVPAANKEKYKAFATMHGKLLKEYGATRVIEAWERDVPEGKVTDCKRAVKLKADEKVVFSWIEWPSKAVRDAAWEKIFADPTMKGEEMPFDGSRLIHGGFVPLLDK